MMDREVQLQRSVLLQTRYAPMVKAYLYPALKTLGLDYFWFVRLLEGPFHISIGNQPPMVELYRRRKTEDLYYRDPNILSREQTTVIWDLHEKTILTEDMSNEIGLKNGMCIFKRKKSYVDVFYIASSNNSNLYNLYLNDTRAIFRLIGFFQEKVLPMLPMNEKDFLLPYMDGTILSLPPVKSKDLADFYDATVMKKFTLHGDQEDVVLTLREVQCLHRLSKGETSKEIANALGISFRTVEYYLDGIRNKTGCPDKGALIALYQKNDLALWFGI